MLFADLLMLPVLAYQQGVYVKHVLKQDFVCCTYSGCCKQDGGRGPAPQMQLNAEPVPP